MRFHLIDRIIEYEQWKKAKGLKNITLSDELMEGDVFPSVLLCESALQTIAWLVVKSSNKMKRPIILSVGSINFFFEAKNGYPIITNVGFEEVQEDMDLAVCSGSILQGEKKLLAFNNCMMKFLNTKNLENESDTSSVLNLMYRDE